MANVLGARIAGNLVYTDTHSRRIVDAIGPDVIKYLNDFTHGVHTASELDPEWTITRVEAGAGESTFALGDVVGGAAVITTDAAENDGINAQVIGEHFKLAAGVQALYFGARFKISHATESDFFIGLSITDTDILGGVTDDIGFRKPDASATVSYIVEKDSAETTAAAFTTDTAYHILEFYYNGATSHLAFLVDGVSVATPVITNLPNDEELRVSVQFLTGEALAKTMTIDWINCVQIGGRAAS